ncbi:MAG: hypothetical protein JXB49_15425 [Bacteroidales bacterium]|nr:hypothetical protein [Bacteroidales bacterium]MBN2817968.1 hypothetical protein [Bacteroidales bacterium]
MLGSKKEKIEFVDSKVEREEIKGFSIKGMLDGSLLAGTAFAKQLPFILFLVFLAIIYIGNRYNAEKLVRQLITVREEVKNMRAEQITTASELMNDSKPSTLEEMVEQRGLGLKQPSSPPHKIIVED